MTKIIKVFTTRIVLNILYWLVIFESSKVLAGKN